MTKQLDDLWFVCDVCGSEYGHNLELLNVNDEDIHPQEKIDWAYKTTSYENRYDAITKANIRIQHENKKCESKG